MIIFQSKVKQTRCLDLGLMNPNKKLQLRPLFLNSAELCHVSYTISHCSWLLLSTVWTGRAVALKAVCGLITVCTHKYLCVHACVDMPWHLTVLFVCKYEWLQYVCHICNFFKFFSHAGGLLLPKLLHVSNNSHLWWWSSLFESD